MIEWVAYVLLGIGSACALIGAMGIVRLPDVYNRIHANTVIVVGGSILLMIGAGILGGLSVFTLKALVIALFLFLTNPVGSHAIARAAHKSGVKLWPRSVVDKLKEEKPWKS
ncbi:MAG: monovalent cation/H(+) antiporter subunit G [Hadesarchaea archaeon]|nr:monovalent cation/H(+) antiporter subunit G [Hadesarchaea archaeon]